MNTRTLNRALDRVAPVTEAPLRALDYSLLRFKPELL
jgi:hypothetical protein